MQRHSYWAGNYWKIEEEEEISEDDGLNDLLANVAFLTHNVIFKVSVQSL